MNFLDTLENLVNQTAFMSLTVGNYIMIVVACVFLYLAIKKGYEPLLLVPIAFGMLLVNMYPDIMKVPADGEAGGLLHYFYLLDEWSILPSLIFMGVGAMTDFGPLIANPKSFLLGAAAQFGIYSAYFLAILMGFNGMAAASISIIGGADGPTSIFLAGKLGQTELLGPIAVAAYSYVKYHNVNGLVPTVLVKRDIPQEVTDAVNAVWGKCCYYNGKVAQTVYTASSAGTTASAVNVWGGADVPYLTSVATPFDAQSDPNYGVITVFTEDQIRTALESSLGITLSEDPANWLTVTSRVDGNYVSGLNVDNQLTISGMRLREKVLKYSIKSWCFDVSYADGEFTFITYGYGHGVGMSQNGANILGKQGYTYDQILAYYFPGITIE